MSSRRSLLGKELEPAIGEGYVGRAFALSFPADYKAERLVATILTAYFDESGTHAGAKAVSVAGYVSTVKAWESFEREWRESLAIYNIDHFHMTDFVAGQGQFTNWPKQKKRSRLRKLIDAANRHALAAIGIVIPANLYQRLSEQDRAVCDSPYRIAAMQCCAEIRRWLETFDSNAEVAYVFEAGAKGAGKVAEFFRAAMDEKAAKEHLRILSFKFEDKKRSAPLQAADILAWELYRNVPSIRGMDSRAPRIKDYNRLRRAKFSTFRYPTLDHLKTMVGVILGMNLSAGKN
ncbi:MAG: DUF3800 domain-containing protein [Candidatus Rokubacteria bacterium]|nr:DUF3800 domain-containing protein [Candidatus Rokubacteria bacterium]